MADQAVTAANVLASSGATVDRSKTSGGTVTAGEPVSLNASNQWVPLANGTTSVLAGVGSNKCGMALHAALSGQPLAVALQDPSYTPGFTGAVGQTVWTSANAGGLTITAADNSTTGQYIGILGVMITTTTMILNPTISTGAHA